MDNHVFGGTEKQVKICLRVSPDIKDRLDLMAREKGCSLNKLLNDLLASGLNGDSSDDGDDEYNSDNGHKPTSLGHPDEHSGMTPYGLNEDDDDYPGNEPLIEKHEDKDVPF